MPFLSAIFQNPVKTSQNPKSIKNFMYKRKLECYEDNGGVTVEF